MTKKLTNKDRDEWRQTLHIMFAKAMTLLPRNPEVDDGFKERSKEFEDNVAIHVSKDMIDQVDLYIDTFSGHGE